MFYVYVNAVVGYVPVGTHPRERAKMLLLLVELRRAFPVRSRAGSRVH